MLHYHIETNNNIIFIVIPIVKGECTMMYSKNTVLRFTRFTLVFIQLIIKFIFIYPASSHSNKQQQYLTALISYNLATAKRPDCIRGQQINVRIS